jgi:hypothetical protein
MNPHARKIMSAFLMLMGARQSRAPISASSAVHPSVENATSDESNQATCSADLFTSRLRMIARAQASGVKAVGGSFGATIDIL